MLKWIREALGAGTPETPLESSPVAEQWAKRLLTILEPIDRLVGARAGLARDMTRYVLHGEPISLLSEVTGHAVAAGYFHLTGFQHKRNARIDAIYEDFDRLPPSVALRWARLLDASIAITGQTQHVMQIEGGIHWPETLMMNLAGSNLHGWSSQRPVVKGLSASTMEAMLVEAGLPPFALLVSAFGTPVKGRYGALQRLPMVTDLIGYAEHLEQHIDAVRPLLLAPIVDQRVLMLGLLGKANHQTLAAIATELGELATTGSKQVRAAAEPLIGRAGKAIQAALKMVAKEAKPEQRVNALRLLWTLAGNEDDGHLREYCREAAASDKAPLAQALVPEWERQGMAAQTEQKNYAYVVPIIDWSNALSPAISDALKAFWEELNRFVEKSNQAARERHAIGLAKGQRWPLNLLEPYTDGELRRLRDYIATPDARLDGKGHPTHLYNLNEMIGRLATAPGMTPVALLKTMTFLHQGRGTHSLDHGIIVAFNAMHRHSGNPSLLELAQMLEPVGYSSADILDSYCSTWGSLAGDWPTQAVWPFFAHNQDLLTKYLVQTGPKSYSFNQNKVYAAIGTLPWPMATTIDALFDLALGTAKLERMPAQRALMNFQGKDARIIDALGSGKAEVRTVAARWLMQLACVDALPALEAAVRIEKSDVAKGAMLDALQKFGQPVEKYLDRAALLKEAGKALAKGLPKDLEWFPWDAMPKVRWSDTGEQVASDVLRLLLMQSVKQKSPEPNAVLRKFCGMFESREREQFGQFVLEAWLREDVRPISPENAMASAAQHAKTMFGHMQRSPQYFPNDPNLGKTEQELLAAYLPGFLRQPAGSAIGSKGVLAVVAACAAERAAAPVARYLKEYYGTRAAHGKALIAMLAWIDHPGATQLVLSIGSRFRTKSFQEEATRQAEALAERKGWTLAELADRTIPSAGFDETGTLELSYGERSFSARLLADFKVELFNADGKKIAALPEPRMSDDADLAKAAKQTFAGAKKEIKSIVTLQTERLYEALCTERDWSFEDWNVYLNQHAIVRRLIQRLVWAHVEEGRIVQTFRPLDDGSLSDCDDNEVNLPAASRVRLAHDSILGAVDVAAWQQHLSDYDVVPLFQQLGKGTYVLPEEKAKSDAIKDFEGHLVEAFALRGRALKLGYTRGAAEDGGWFHVYEKRFPTLGLVAVLEFTGNPLPEENRTVALLNMSFSSSGEQSWQRGRFPLGEVQKVLLSECYNDLRLIAAEGTGFDPAWEKKSEY